MRRKILKFFYPVLMWIQNKINRGTKRLSGKDKTPSVSFYALFAAMNSGHTLEFNKFRGKKVLLVNTASDCGYTHQYQQLQELYEQYKDRLVVLAFPANDFKEQEKGTDAEIAEFCMKNYYIGFTLMKKSAVKRIPDQNLVYQWLTDPEQNGWCSQQPEWNFSKYLVNEEGVLMNYFGPSVSPLDNEIIAAITNN